MRTFIMTIQVNDDGLDDVGEDHFVDAIATVLSQTATMAHGSLVELRELATPHSRAIRSTWVTSTKL